MPRDVARGGVRINDSMRDVNIAGWPLRESVDIEDF
jgi:hypothetical protein